MKCVLKSLVFGAALLVCGSGAGSDSAFARSSSRWIDLGDGLEWDVVTVRNVAPSLYAVYYRHKTINAEREYLRRTGAFDNAYISRIMYGRSGVYINCRSKKFAIFSATNLDNNRQIMGETSYVNDRDIQWEAIEPETTMEAVSFSVCSFFEGK